MAISYTTDLAGTAAGSAASAGQSAAMQLPGYMTSMSNIGNNIASETAGQVPADVIEQLKEQGAESNVSTGSSGNAGYLKALGLTSLGLTQTGQQNLENILPSTPGYTVSQNPEFQTSANLQYEAQTQQQVWQKQAEQQAIALQQQAQALAAAKAGLGGSGTSWGRPTPPAAIGPAADNNVNPSYVPNPWQTDTSNQPGSTGAYAAWNAWNGSPVYNNATPVPAPTAANAGNANSPYYDFEANQMVYPGDTGDGSGDEVAATAQPPGY